MSQLIKTFAAGMFLSLGVFTLSFGQNIYASNPAITSDAAIALPLEGQNSSTSVATGTRAEVNFSTLFPNATEQKWSNTEGNSFVSFLNNGRKATASFDAKGKMNYAITACSMQQLPEAFSKEIKTNYAAYQLFHATEIKAYGETAYQAIIENNTDFITLKYTADGIEEIQSVKK